MWRSIRLPIPLTFIRSSITPPGTSPGGFFYCQLQEIPPSHHSTVVRQKKWCYTLFCGFSECPCIFFAGLFNLALKDGGTGKNNSFLRSHNLYFIGWACFSLMKLGEITRLNRMEPMDGISVHFFKMHWLGPCFSIPDELYSTEIRSPQKTGWGQWTTSSPATILSLMPEITKNVRHVIYAENWCSQQVFADLMDQFVYAKIAFIAWTRCRKPTSSPVSSAF